MRATPFVFTLVALCAQAQVKVDLRQDRIDVKIDGKPFTELYMGKDAHKPFLYPIRTASGKRITRGFPMEQLPNDPVDHPHQTGLWIGCERLSGVDFWENDPSYHRPRMGTIVFKDVSSLKNEAAQGSFTMLADWVSPEGATFISETRTMTFYAKPANCRMFDIDLRLKAKQDVTFQDHHDSVIGLRLGPAFDEKNGGKPINEQGQVGEKLTRGQRSRWVDWQADVEGESVGAAIFDHPSNFNAPTTWHIRSMGLLVASPFAQRDYAATAADGSKLLPAGEELHLRYRVLIHPLTVDLNQVFQEFSAK